jgi:hypothetical protein
MRELYTYDSNETVYDPAGMCKYTSDYNACCSSGEGIEFTTDKNAIEQFIVPDVESQDRDLAILFTGKEDYSRAIAPLGSIPDIDILF